ncbi:MAG: T9SS type A sorting domain-containing protein [Bacteroidota bacterium]|nr:T9SS type A sorting domain-containing protein [Bacteroidota bacterium]
MKYIYSIFAFLLILTSINAQTPTVDFETNGDCYISPSTGNSGTATVADDTVDASTYGKVVNIIDPATMYDSWSIRLDNKISFATDKVLSFDFRDPTATARTILLKVSGGNDTYSLAGADGVEGTADDVVVTAYEVSATSQAVDTWQTLTFDFSSANGSYPNTAAAGKDLVGEYSALDLFIDFGSEVGSNTFVDNFRGGSQGAANALPGPTTAAADPTATHNAADVVSLYSDAYTSASEATSWVLSPGWGQSTATAEVGLDPCDSDPADSFIRMNNLDYQGHIFAAQDVSGMTHLHFDVWAENAGDLTATLISLNATQEAPVTTTLTAGSWVSVNIPLTDFSTANSNINLAAIEQFKWVGAAALGYVYIDNIYFWAPPSTDTEISFSVDTRNNSTYPSATNGININYSTDGGTTYTLSNLLTESSTTAGVYEGTVTLPKSTGDVKYQVALTDVSDGYSSIVASSGDTLDSDADFTVTTGANAVSASIFLLDRDASASSFATLTSSAQVTITVIIRGHHPDHNDGQYGVRSVGGACYSLGDWTTNTNGVFEDTMTTPFYTTVAYNVGYHSSALNNWCGDNAVTKDATTNADFSVSVVESDVTEDLSALSAVDTNGNYLTYTSSLSLNDIDVELTVYPNPADQFIAVKSSEIISGLRIIDMTGKEVIRKSIQSNDTTLDLGNLNTGIYFLEAKAGKATKTMRFIKK